MAIRISGIKHEANTYVVLFIPLLLTLPFSVRLPNILIAVAAVYWILFDRNKRIKNIKTLIILLLLFVPYAVGVAYSTETREALFGLEKRLPFFGLPILFATITFSHRQIQYLLIAFLLSTLAGAIYCVAFELVNHLQTYGTLDPLNLDFFKLSELTQGIELDPPYFGLYIGFSLIITSYLFRVKLISLLPFLIINVFLGLFILLSGARTGMLGLAVSIFVFWFMEKRTKVIVPAAAILLLIATIALQDEVLKNRFYDAITVKSTKDTGTPSSLSLRLAEWKSAFYIIQNHWIIGVGTGDYQNELNKSFLLHGVTEAYENEYNAHNQYLEIAVALGTVGLIALMSNIGFALFIAIQNKNWVYLAFLVLVMTCLLTESMLERQKGIVFFAFFNSLFAFHSLTTPSTKNHVAPHLVRNRS